MGVLSPFRHNSARIVLWAPTFVPQCSRRRLQSSVADTNTCIRQQLRSKIEITSSTVTDIWSLPLLLPEGSQLGSPARRTVRRRRMGRTHLLKGAMAWPMRISEYATSDTACHVKQGRHREKGRSGSLEGPSIPLVFSSFSHL